jgi:hypothetical protein
LRGEKVIAVLTDCGEINAASSEIQCGRQNESSAALKKARYSNFWISYVNCSIIARLKENAVVALGREIARVN